METDALLIPGLVFIMACAGTGLIRRYALCRSLLDIPNSRSSHRTPTPRGGGIAIAVACLTGVMLFRWLDGLADGLFMALLGGGLSVLAISIWDDHRSLPRSLRLSVHVAAVCWAVYWLTDGLAAIDTLGAGILSMLQIIGLVWLINLYNFMDGIDGLAGSEAVFVSVAACLLIDHGGIGALLVLVAVSAAGFLPWNWSPARIFMGDSGSCFLGFALGVLALASIREHALPLGVWLILLGVFLIDASVTLVRRMLSGQPWYEAHRSHAYQHAVRRWHHHGRVTLAVGVLNLAWLFPWAWAVVSWPRWNVLFVLVALTPLLVLALFLGAGREQANGGRGVASG